MKQYKNTVQTIQNTINTSTHITKTPTHTHTHILQNKLKQPQYKLIVLIPYLRFGTSDRFHLQGSKNPKGKLILGFLDT